MEDMETDDSSSLDGNGDKSGVCAGPRRVHKLDSRAGRSSHLDTCAACYTHREDRRDPGDQEADCGCQQARDADVKDGGWEMRVQSVL